MTDRFPVLTEVWRGAIVEARHRGAITIVDPEGRVLAEVGDASAATSTRSAIKMIQAIPLVTSGAAGRFQITPAELALACASHNGEPMHVATAAAMLARAGLDESALACGAHAPYDPASARELELAGKPFTQLHNNCSGKHAGMLLTAVHRGLPIADYFTPEHPVQREILTALLRLADLPETPPTAIDGCSAPTFGVPLRGLALALARLMRLTMSEPPAGGRLAGLAVDYGEAARRVVSAMIEHPEMIGGTARFDTDLLRAGRGRLICKVGAEAVYVVGILPCERFPQGAGVALKIEDGSYRGMGPAVVETLAQAGVLDPQALAELAAYHHPAVENRRGLVVGEVRPVFRLPMKI